MALPINIKTEHLTHPPLPVAEPHLELQPHEAPVAEPVHQPDKHVTEHHPPVHLVTPEKGVTDTKRHKGKQRSASNLSDAEPLAHSIAVVLLVHQNLFFLFHP